MLQLYYLVKFELKKHFHNLNYIASLFFFFVMVVALYPFAIGMEEEILTKIGVGVIWSGALLASVISIPLYFARDRASGVLEQLYLQEFPFVFVVIGKMFAHWLVIVIPLLILAPIMANLFHLDRPIIETLIKSLLIGTPLLSVITCLGAALTLGIKRGGGVASLVILPLYIPIIIFGTLAGDYMYINLAILLITLPFVLMISSYALKLNLD